MGGEHFNEGPACDAVLRLLERQRGACRRNLQFPEREHHRFPVELVCELNGELVALEHTGTEPFEGHVKLIKEAKRRVQPLVDAVASLLPQSEDFFLEVPLESFGLLKGKELDAAHRALKERLVEVAPSLPIADLGRRIPGPGMTVPNVPFKVRLHREARYGDIRIPFHVEFRAGDVEKLRLERMRRTVQDKCPKLAGWKASLRAHTVLILEWSHADFSLTNQYLIADALLAAERGIEDPADDVYLVATLVDPWRVYTLRQGARTLFEIGPAAGTWEVPVRDLVDITNSAAP